MTNKEAFLRKLIEITCKDCDTIIVYSDSNLDNVRDIFLKLKEEYHLKQLIFYEMDHKKLYEFFKTNPTEKEIKKRVFKIPEITDPERTKIIYNYPDDYEGYVGKLNKEYRDKYNFFYDQHALVNKKFWELYDTVENMVLTILPDNTWAKYTLGSKRKEGKLWELINKTVPPIDEFNDYQKRMNEIKEYLQKSKIKNLRFHTSLGTDFRIGLTKRSLWLIEPELINGKYCYANFPSYEIYTSPDCYSASGKIVMSRPCLYYGRPVNQGEFEFNKGLCTKVDTDCSFFNRQVSKDKYHLNRIGEIALVSNDSPIAKLKQNFDSVLLDENAGCHFALGDSINECINLDQSKLEEIDKKKYHFNVSKYHFDFVFGDDSVSVEADLGNNKKVLLLENGTWKI